MLGFTPTAPARWRSSSSVDDEGYRRHLSTALDLQPQLVAAGARNDWEERQRRSTILGMAVDGFGEIDGNDQQVRAGAEIGFEIGDFPS